MHFLIGDGAGVEGAVLGLRDRLAEGVVLGEALGLRDGLAAGGALGEELGLRGGLADGEALGEELGLAGRCAMACTWTKFWARAAGRNISSMGKKTSRVFVAVLPSLCVAAYSTL